MTKIKDGVPDTKVTKNEKEMEVGESCKEKPPLFSLLNLTTVRLTQKWPEEKTS